MGLRVVPFRCVLAGVVVLAFSACGDNRAKSLRPQGGDPQAQNRGGGKRSGTETGTGTSTHSGITTGLISSTGTGTGTGVGSSTATGSASGISTGIRTGSSTGIGTGTGSIVTTPTPALFRFNYAPGELTELCAKAKAETERRIDTITAIKPEDRNPDNTLLAFEIAFADLRDVANTLVFQKDVGVDPAIRTEAKSCNDLINGYDVQAMTSKPLYEAVKSVKPRSIEEARLHSETIKRFEANGLALDDARLTEVRARLTEISKNQTAFRGNVTSDPTTLTLSEEQLKGMQADFFKRKTISPGPTPGTYVVKVDEANYVEIAQNAVDPETRRTNERAFLSRAKEPNVKLLEDTVKLRSEAAKLLGFDTWADRQTRHRMVNDGNPNANGGAYRALAWVNRLKSRLHGRNRSDLSELLAHKKALASAAGQDPTQITLQQEDIRFLEFQLRQKRFQLDNAAIRAYFPADRVVTGMFAAYQKLLGVRYSERPDLVPWAPGARSYEIHDAATGMLIGRFGTDFQPREGKYDHAAAFTLIKGRHVGGKPNVPLSVIVSNFTPPTADKPSLLTHKEVETVFHEFGHIMHQTLTRAPYASLAGSSVVRDFVEAPSQMLENWVWDPAILKSLSGHYQTGEPLPDETIQKMISARSFNSGYFYTRQIYLSLLDLVLSTSIDPAKVDVLKTERDLYRAIIGVEPLEDTAMPASFGHLMGGYDAGYYGYLWSKVYAEDMFTLFKDKLLDGEIGAKYRSTILASGGMKDASVLLEEFLGRKPDPAAFFRSLGIPESKRQGSTQKR